MTNKVAKLQRACLMDPVKLEVAQKYSTVDTLRQQYLFVPAKYKVRSKCCRHAQHMQQVALTNAKSSKYSGPEFADMQAC